MEKVNWRSKKAAEFIQNQAPCTNMAKKSRFWNNSIRLFNWLILDDNWFLRYLITDCIRSIYLLFMLIWDWISLLKINKNKLILIESRKIIAMGNSLTDCTKSNN